MKRKPKALKSSGAILNCVSAKFIKDPYDCIQIKAWNGHLSLTKKEVFKLFGWLKLAREYLAENKDGQDDT